jgi:hypothetical protein
MVPAMTGKKTRETTSTICDVRPSPNQRMNSGASAIFGAVWKKKR